MTTQKNSELLKPQDEKISNNDPQALAEEPTAESQYQLGMLYLEKNDKVQAVECFIQAAKKDHVLAQYRLGVCYAYGEGIEQNLPKAIDLFEEAAKKDHSDAIAVLKLINQIHLETELKLTHESVNQDVLDRDFFEKNSKVVDFFIKATVENDSKAQYNLGMCYFKGEGVEKNLAKAVEFLKKAAEKSNPGAQYQLGICYRDGLGVPQDKKEAMNCFGKAGEKNQNAELAFRSICIEFAEKGDPDSCFRLGVWHNSGINGFQKNVDAAKKYFKIAADKKHQLALNMLENISFQEKNERPSSQMPQQESEESTSLRCQDEKDDPKDLKNVSPFFEKTPKKIIPEEEYKLGMRYLEGTDVNKDIDEARRLFISAANWGYPKAQYQLGLYYESGLLNLPVDKSESLKWLRKAANKGHQEAAIHLVEIYKKDAEQNNYPEAQYQLALCFKDGFGVVKKDEKEAVKWYEKAAEQGFTPAQLNLGVCYARGEGIERNLAKAVKLYEQAAIKEPEAQYNLGICYKNGSGVEKNNIEAMRLFHQASESCFKLAYEKLTSIYEELANEGDPEAQYNLGLCYKDQLLGIYENKEEAAKWFRKAIEKNHEKAKAALLEVYKKSDNPEFAYLLGKLYENGEMGLTQDRNEAVNCFIKAAEKHNREAQYQLGICYRDGLGVAQDKKEAKKWFLKASEKIQDAELQVKSICIELAEQKDPDSCFILGIWHNNGMHGFRKDVDEAIKYLNMAGKEHKLAQTMLGKISALPKENKKESLPSISYVAPQSTFPPPPSSMPLLSSISTSPSSQQEPEKSTNTLN